MAPVTLKTVDGECIQFSKTITELIQGADDLKDVIQHLFEIQSAVHGYLGPETQQELVRKMYVLTQLKPIVPLSRLSMGVPSLHSPRVYTSSKAQTNKKASKNLTLALSTLSQHTNLPPTESTQSTEPSDPSNPPLSSIQLPPEIIDYVDAARNPDIYTREFVELVQRGNQDLKGKREAFAGFRDVLAREMRSAMPECRAEVDRAVAASTSSGGGGRPDGAERRDSL